jgi:hypothetical protein
MHEHLQKKAEMAEKTHMLEPTKLGIGFWLSFCE